MKTCIRPVYWLAAILFTVSLPLAADEVGAGISDIQNRWAEANYALPKPERADAFKRIAASAESLAKSHPGRAEPLVWEGIVLGAEAGERGGLQALRLAGRSRAVLESALAIDPAALEGSAYTSLGTLYHKVPGFPIGFGSDRKARDFLKKALAINPDGIDPNFFYAEFLHDTGNDAEAVRHLRKALAAAPRPGRSQADAGRRADAERLLRSIGDT